MVGLMIIVEINGSEPCQRTAGVHRKPVVAAQEKAFTRGAGNRRGLVSTCMRYYDDPGDDTCVVVDIELGTPDAPAQRLNHIIEKPWPRW